MMNSPSALVTAARRFCMTQSQKWAREYSCLERSGRSRIKRLFGNWNYSSEAYKLFPRYRLDDLVLAQMEKLSGKLFESYEQAQMEVLRAAENAEKELVKEFATTEGALGAIHAELQEIRSFITRGEGEWLSEIEPLPFQRTLTTEESDRYWSILKQKWLVERSTYWYPLSEVDPGFNVIAFHRELWDVRAGVAILRQELARRNIGSCIVLREFDAEYELESVGVDPSYDLAETFTTSDFEWLVYASHESSITVGGWAADLFRKHWADWKTMTYGGPFHTDDLRGTWEIK